MHGVTVFLAMILEYKRIVYICFMIFIVFVFTNFSTLELRNQKNGLQILILREVSSPEPAPKVRKPKSRSKIQVFIFGRGDKK